MYVLGIGNVDRWAVCAFTKYFSVVIVILPFYFKQGKLKEGKEGEVVMVSSLEM